MTFHGFEKGTVVPATIPRQNTDLFLLFRFQLSKYLIFRHDSPSVIFWRYNPLLSGIPHKEQHRLLHRGDEPNMEREADCFASHLLCPRPTMGRLCARENTFSVEQAAVLAYVSASALQRLSRVEELAVSPEILSVADDLLADWAQRVPLPPQRPGQHRLQIRTKFLPRA